ncbi:MAG TPA: hypothetical protein VJU16_08760 [Planctomycetota bacterium]|nr:hypothetical protein [Planctomycetota bacterium]
MPDAAEKKKETRRRARRAVSYLGRLLTLVGVLSVVAALYLTLRTWVVEGLIRDLAQSLLHPLITADVDRVGRVEIDADGNLVLHRVVISTQRDGVRRLFYRADKIVIALDGWPLRDADLRVARIDIFHPEIYVRREFVSGWNLLWALRPRPKPADAEPPPPPAGPPPLVSRPVVPKAPVGDPFPFNGVHLHDGIVHVAIEGRTREVSYVVTGVEARILRRDDMIVFEPIYGDFYGGRLTGHAIIRSFRPFAIDVRLAVKEADVSRLSERANFVSRPVSGKLDSVLAITSDANTNHRPVGAGRIEITEGDLYELPAFTGILGLLALNPVPDRIVNSAQILYTIERDVVRIDEMNFLGSPLSLFGDGTMGLTGEDLNLVFVPRLEKGIMSLIVAPIALLTDLALGQWVPVVVTGSFWEPKVNAEPEAKVREAIQKKAGGTQKAPK